MIFLGFDPGAAGAVAMISAFIPDKAEVISVSPFDITMYRAVINSAICREMSNQRCRAVVEDVHAMPGQGVTSMFSFGRNKGIIEGMLSYARIQYNLVSPRKWKSEFSLVFPRGTEKAFIKGMSIRRAQELFPGTCLRPTKRCKVDSDGMAEALLMAEYARRKYFNITKP